MTAREYLGTLSDAKLLRLVAKFTMNHDDYVNKYPDCYSEEDYAMETSYIKSVDYDKREDELVRLISELADRLERAGK